MDAYRNNTLLQWAITKHLDFVTSFKLQIQTRNQKLNSDIEQLWRWWTTKCDISDRFNFDQMIRLLETQRTVFGDGFIYLDDKFGKIGIIQSDCICQPDGQKLQGEWVQGMKLGRNGQVTHYAWCQRSGINGRKLIEIIPAKNILKIQFQTRYDQYRGISPVASCLNQLRDLYQAKGYLLGKMKMQALFGVVVTRQSDMDVNTGIKMGSDGTTSYDIKPNNGVIYTQMEPGDDMKFLTSQSPGADVQTFINQMLEQCLKALDIDIALYNSTLSSFSGNKAAIGMFQISIQQKQKKLIKIQKQIFYWILNKWISDGILDLPDGIQVYEIDFDFIPTVSLSFFDSLKDAKQDNILLARGGTNYQEIAKRNGTDWRKNIDLIAQQIAYAKEKGVDLTLAGISGISVTNPNPNQNTGN